MTKNFMMHSMSMSNVFLNGMIKSARYRTSNSMIFFFMLLLIPLYLCFPLLLFTFQ